MSRNVTCWAEAGAADTTVAQHTPIAKTAQRFVSGHDFSRADRYVFRVAAAVVAFATTAAEFLFGPFAARLKPCPDTNLVQLDI